MARRTAALGGLLACLFGSDVSAALSSARTISVTYDAATAAAGLAAAGLDTSSPTVTGRVRVYLTRNNNTLPYESDADEASSAQVRRAWNNTYHHHHRHHHHRRRRRHHRRHRRRRHPNEFADIPEKLEPFPHPPPTFPPIPPYPPNPPTRHIHP